MRFAIIVLVLSSAPAWGADYVAGKGSTLGFAASYQGESFTGRFTRFTPSIRFDPAAPAACRFDVRIELGSANTANAERDEMLAAEEFFDVGSQPEARYIASRCRALGGNRYVAEGSLTLRGATRPVPLAFTWTAGAKPVLDGKASLKRLDFGVGVGDWADTGLLPNAVSVSTRLVLLPRPTGKP